MAFLFADGVEVLRQLAHRLPRFGTIQRNVVSIAHLPQADGLSIAMPDGNTEK
jgi:hypothetical protein